SARAEAALRSATTVPARCRTRIRSAGRRLPSSRGENRGEPMATVELWIQIENHAWDVSPHNIDRMTGQTLQQRDGTAPVTKTLMSPVTGHVQNRLMFKPLSE